jgi:phosphopantetheinyl transferase (holo-ACP synthase)
MIGNDVVDLACEESLPGARNPRFDERVYADAERQALGDSDTPDLLRWLFWAAKESAYKLARRMDPALVWSPRSFEVTLDDSLAGPVRWPGGSCVVRIAHEDERVHAVAARDEADLARARVRIARLDQASGSDTSPSRAVRSLAIHDLAPHLGIDPSALELRRSGRLPSLFANERPVAWPISLSHHGRFIAFAALPTELRA